MLLGTNYLESFGKDSKFLGANSIDVTLNPKIFIMNPGHRIDIFNPDIEGLYIEQEIRPTGFAIRPGQLILASTNERFNIDDLSEEEVSEIIGINSRLVQMLHGRSTLARLGLSIHLCAGFGDIGYNRPWTLEITNHGPNPIVLYPNIRIAQVSFHVVMCSQFADDYKDGTYNKNTYKDTSILPKLGKDRF